MNGTSILTGQYLCGAFKVTAHVPEPKLRACHCDKCRRHTSATFVSIETAQTGMTVAGPAKSYKSSGSVERGFCGTCGSTLWYGTLSDGARHLAAGLFDDAGGAAMTLEFFADRCPQGYSLAGNQRRLSTTETIAMFDGDGA